MLSNRSSAGLLESLQLPDSVLDEYSEDELAAAVAAALPEFVARRVRRTIPWVMAAILVLFVSIRIVTSSHPATTPDGLRPSVAAGRSATPATTAPTNASIGQEAQIAQATVPAGVPSTGGSASPGADASSSPPPPLSSLTPSSGPLRITDSGYTSSTGGTPLENKPPPGALPVASAFGQHLERSFIRLNGNGQTLRLRLAAGTTNVGAEIAQISLCSVTQGWHAVRGSALSSGPTFDPSDCAVGKRAADGTWTFDLAATSHGATNPNGFALVPATGTVTSFSLTFSSDAVSQ